MLDLTECTVLGGGGFPFNAGEKLAIRFDGDTVTFLGQPNAATISLAELVDISVSGPGSVTSGGGFAGGGFGIEGAISGIALAGVLNAVTSRTKIHTFISLICNFGELHLHFAGMEPSALRIALAPVHVRLRQLDPVWQATRLETLEAALASSSVPQQQFEVLRTRLVKGPDWEAVAYAAQQAIAGQETEALERMARLPKGSVRVAKRSFLLTRRNVRNARRCLALAQLGR